MSASPTSHASFWLNDHDDARDLFSITSANRPRAFVSLCAAAFAVLLCCWLNHFQLSFNAHSYILMQRHKCAKVLLAALAWCLFECTHLIVHSLLKRRFRS